MAAVLVTAVGSFQSCKDYDDDINAVEQNVQKLQEQQDKLTAALNQAKSELQTAQSAADAAIKAAAKDASDANAAAKNANDAITALATVAAKKADVEALESVIRDLNALKNADETAIANLAGRIDAIDGTLNVLTAGLQDVAGVKGDIAEALEAIAALKADMQQQISALNIFKESVDTQLTDIKEILKTNGNLDALTDLATKVANAEESIADLKTRIEKVDADNKQNIADMRKQIEDLQPKITEVVTLVQSVDTTISTLNIFVDNCLTSLVLRPTLYYGGIEAVEAIHAEYQPLGFSVYYMDETDDQNYHQQPYVYNEKGEIVGVNKVAYNRTTDNGYEIAYEYNAKDSLVYKYPTMDVYYHVNPNTVTYNDIASLELNTDDKRYVNTSNTRAERNSVNKWLDLTGANEFEVKQGILHAKLKNNADIWHRIEQYKHNVTVFSIEANAYDSDKNPTRKVSSDWAAIARVHQNNFRIADNDAYILHYSQYPHINYPQDTYCAMMDMQQRQWTESHSYTYESQTDATKYNRDPIHVYRQAKQAIDSPYTHLLPWNGSVDLNEVIEVHADHHYFNAEDQVLDASATDRIYDFPVDLEKLGFVRRYTLVNYQYPIDGADHNYNGTQESQHAHIEADGHTLTANFVKNGLRDAETQNKSSVGREPLVMIEIIDTNDPMTWSPDHMRWCKDTTNFQNDPKHNLVAVGFVKFKIVDEQAPVVLGPIEVMSDAMYASCAGDTVLANWYQVEEQILAKLGEQGVEKSSFESNYTLRNLTGEDITLRELALLSPTQYYFNGQIYVPQTNQQQIIATRKNWVDNVNYGNAANWVLPDVVLNHDITEEGFVDRDRYGHIVYTNYDWQHRETNLIGVAMSAEQMLQQLVKRDHRGHYLDSLGNKVGTLAEADFYPSVKTKVAAKLVAPNHNGFPEVTIIFDLTIYLNKATMKRPAMTAAEGGNWYAKEGGPVEYINANIDAHHNGTYTHDVRRFVANLQQSLASQLWEASTTTFDGSDFQPRAFDFYFDEIKDQPNGMPAKARAAVQRFKLHSRGNLHGDLYFYTNNWLGDIEEGTPYWHDWQRTADYKDDHFYADRYLIKVCYTNNPADTVVWAQEGAPGQSHIGKLGKYLFAYKYIEDYTRTPSTIVTTGIANTSSFDMANGQLIAWIDNIDDHLLATGQSAAMNRDANGRLNENVNVHYNYYSDYARDLLNRAGRYAEHAGKTYDGYSRALDNEFTAYVHLNLFEGDCVPGINLNIDTQNGEVEADWTHTHAGDPNYMAADNLILDPHGSYLPAVEPNQYYPVHRPKGVPVMLCNPDFKIRFERPLNVEMKSPWEQPYITGVTDATEGTTTVKVTFKDMFRRQGGSPERQFPMDWRNLKYFGTGSKACVGYIQGYNDGTDNNFTNPVYPIYTMDGTLIPFDSRWAMPWNMDPQTLSTAIGDQWFKSREAERSDADPYYLYKFNPVPFKKDVQDPQDWTADNVVPNIGHMLTNYGGDENFVEYRFSQISNLLDWDVTRNVNNNIESITFKYYNDAINRGDFDIIIPVTIKYAWGDITTTGRWIPTVNVGSTENALFNIAPGANDTNKKTYQSLNTRLHNNNMLFVRIHFGHTVGNN